MEASTRRGFLGAALGTTLAGLAGCSALQTRHLWTTDEPAVLPCLAGNTLYALFGSGSRPRRLGSINPSDGSVIKRMDAPPADIEGPPATRDGLVVLPFDTGVIAFEDGEHLWTTSAPEYGWRNVATGAGRVFVASSTSRSLYALDAASGETLWHETLRTEATNGVQPVVANERLYVATATGVLAYSMDGTQQWTAQLPTVQGLTVDGNRVFVTSRDGLHRIDTADGDSGVLWEAPFGTTLHGPPTVGPERVYLGSDEDSVFAVDRSGALQWEHDVTTRGGSTPAGVTPPTLVDDLAVFVTSGGDARGTYAVDTASGDRRWHASYGQTSWIPLLVHEGILIVQGEDAVHGLSPSPRWSL